VRYLITMGVRIGCFILMVAITPYGWYTWVFGAAAVFLPYIAVVFANTGASGPQSSAENPERALPAPPATAAPTDDERVIRLTEKRGIEQPRERDRPE